MSRLGVFAAVVLLQTPPAQTEAVETVTVALARVAAVPEKYIVREFPGTKVETIVETERPRSKANSRRNRNAA